MRWLYHTRRIRNASFSAAAAAFNSDSHRVHLRLIDTFKKIIASKNLNDSTPKSASGTYKSLLERQIKIEEDQRIQALKEQDEIAASMKMLGRETSLRSVQTSLIEWYEPLIRKLQEEIQNIQNGVAGEDRSRYGPYLLQLRVDKLAMIGLDATISAIMRSGNAGVPTVSITTEIGNLIETEVNLNRLRGCNDPTSMFLKKLIEERPREFNALQKRIRRIATDHEGWSDEIKVKLGAVIVKAIINSVLNGNGKSIFYLTSTFNIHTKKRQGLVKMTDESFKDLDMTKKNAILPRFLPMLVPPQPWDNRVYYGAYYRLKAPLMKHYSKAQSDATKKANMGLVLEGLDYLGTIPWRVNSRVLDVVKVAIDRGLTFGELPSNKNMEEIDFDDFKTLSMNDMKKDETNQKDFVQSKRLYEDYRSRVQKKNSELHSLRCDINIKLSIAEQFLRDIIYFPHNLDFRGRAYPIPPNLSHIGSDLCRGLLMFEDAKELGEDGVRWLKIHIANLWGYNKVTFDERVLWTDKNLSKIIESATQPLQGDMWWSNAENPFQTLAACFELNECLKLSNPALYKSRLPIHQDGSCNGLQHYAGLGRDELGGKAVNLIPSNSPQDVYTKVLEIVLRHVDVDSLIPEEDTNKQLAIKGKLARIVKPLLSRKVIKQTVMTSVYGVTKVGARAQVQARLMELFTSNSAVLSVQQEKELYYAADYVAQLTLISLQEMFTSAKLMMDWLGTVSQLVAKEGQPMSWITPLGLPVSQPYRKESQHAIKTVLQSVVLTLNSDYLPVSSKKQKSAFPPNFVHSLDATHMLTTCLKMKEHNKAFAAVHDSYWTHACDVKFMNKVLRESFVELYEYPILEELKDSVNLRFPFLVLPPIPARGNLEIRNVLKSNYFFH